MSDKEPQLYRWQLGAFRREYADMKFETENHHDITRVWGRVDGYKIVPPALYPNVYNFNDLRGKRIGRLVFKEYLGKIRANRPGRWLALCDCGNYCIRAGHAFTRSKEIQECQDCSFARSNAWKLANG